MAISLWRHDGGAWNNALFVTTDSNVNSWAAVPSDFHSIMGNLWSYHGLELSNRGMNWLRYAI